MISIITVEPTLTATSLQRPFLFGGQSIHSLLFQPLDNGHPLLSQKVAIVERFNCRKKGLPKTATVFNFFSKVTPRYWIASQGKDGFLGRCMMTPLVRLEGHQTPEPSLQWYKIRRGEEKGGELLAACELFLVRLQNCFHSVVRFHEVHHPHPTNWTVGNVFPQNGVVAQKKAGRDAIVGFHMTSLKFKLQNYRSYWNLLSWCIRAAEN